MPRQMLDTIGRALAGTLAALLIAPAAARAQTPAPAPADSMSERFAVLVDRARARLVADGGRLWGDRLDTLQWMGVRDGRAWLTADPQRAGYVRRGRLTSGPLPPGIAPANTSIAWAGRRWAMVMLPLPADSADAIPLLLHEAMHVTQPTLLPAPSYSEGGAGAALLDEPDGRTWLRLELAALARALQGDEAEARSSAADALLFRARRLRTATADERTRERALDVAEGLPEYTALRLTAGAEAPRLLARSIRQGATTERSYVRNFPYLTGPAYALLLDRFAGDGWRARVVRDSVAADLQRRLAGALGLDGQWMRWTAFQPADDAATLDRRARAAAVRYDLTTIERAERDRWTERQRQLADLRRRFVEAPVIRLRPATLRISFDPRRQSALGEVGTVMEGLTWRGDDGAELGAPDGALVAPDWSELRLPLGMVAPRAGVLAAPVEWRGDGWTLRLPAGWRVEQDGRNWLVLPPAGR